MTNIIKRMAGVAKPNICRLAALALGIGFVTTGWGAASLEETGATVPTTATLAFKGAKLSQVTANTLSGVIGGDWAGNIVGNAMTFNNFDRTSEASGTITCQAQIQHDTNVKGVLLTFTQDGSNVKVQKTGAKYISGTVGSSIAGGSDGYYEVNKLQLNVARVVPNACWVENFPSSSTTVNGVSLNPVNGSSTVTDGVITYGNPGNANGPAFSFSAVGYVAVVFTVDFTGVTLAENQILFTLGNSANNGLVGAALKSNGSGGFYATGIWTNNAWTNADDSSNTVTLSGEQTFLAIYNKGEDASTKGTHLYVLDNGVAKVIYGGTSGIALKGGDVTKLGICGAYGSSGSFTNMAGLKLKKVAVYLSSSSLPMTASDLPGHAYTAKFAVANGETINTSTINSGATTFGSAYVSTEAGATINLDAELNGHAITFAGSISGVPGSADGLTLGSANDSVTTTVAANVPNIKGSGTVVYNGVAPDSSYSWMTASAWSGVLWLKNLAIAGLVPANLASANSTLRLTGCTGYFNDGGNTSTCPGTLDLQDDGSTKAFTVDNGWSASGVSIFNKLTGAGTLACSTKDIFQRYVFKDPSEFIGTINCVRTDDASKKYLRVILGNSTDDGDNGTITVASGASATVKTGKTWSANKVVVNGTLNMEDSTAALSGTVSGGGKIVYNDELPNSADFTANTWTGTVEVNGGATTAAGIVAADAAQFMNSSAKFTVASGTVTLGTIAGLTGKVNVKNGATLQIVDGTTTTKYLTLAETSGNLNFAGCTALATLTLDLGRNRDSSIVYPSSLKTLQLILDENLADDTELTFNVGNGTTLEAATVTVYKPDGSTVNNTAAAEVSADGHSVKVTYSPTVDGSAAWCAYEFASNLNNSGSDTTSLSPDGSFSATTSVDGDGKLYTYSHPYRSITYPADGNWSAMVRCTVPKLKEALVISFGTNGGGIIGLAAGETPDTEMRVVQGIAGQSHYITNGIMPVLNGTTAQHVYVFTVKDNKTVKVYCDNELINTVNFDSAFSIGSGLQVGSIHGGIGYGLGRCWKDDTNYSALSEADQKAARIDSLRIYKATLGSNAIAQLSEEFPAVKLFQATISGGTENAWDSLGWTGGDISTINAYSKAIITVADDATLALPESITAEELVFEIASGKTLTLVDAVGGTTLTLGFPLEVNGGALAYAAAASKTIAVNGTGKLKFASGTEITGSLSGTAKVEIANEDSIAVASSGSIANPLTGAGTVTYANYGSLPGALTFDNYWTGTVVLPSFTADGFIFDNYGKTGSTIALTGIVSGWINPNNTTVAAALRLDGAVNITAMSQRTYTFAEIDGEGNLSFATGGDQPTAVSVTKVAEGYTGTISSTLANPVTIATLDRAAGQSTAGGTKLLSTSGNVVANALTIEGVAQQVELCTADDGIYVALVSVTKGDNPTTYYAMVSDAMTAAGSDAATITLLGNTDANVSLAVGQSLVTGGFSVGTVSTSAEHCHVVNNAGVYTVALDQFAVTIPSVANTTVSVSYTSGGVAQVATAAGNVSVDYGTDVTANWTAASGYKITSGASQTLNAVTSAQTLSSPTVEAMGATVSNVAFDYGADYATATVTATVSGDATGYTLTVGQNSYNGSVSGSTVTFSNVETGRSAAYDNVSYTITATDGVSPVPVAGGSGSAVVADVTNWITEDSTHYEATGTWATGVTYTENVAEVSDNTYTANTCSTGDCVTVTLTNVVYPDLSDISDLSSIAADAQGAIALAETTVSETTSTSFMILAKSNDAFVWTAATWAGGTPALNTPYTIVMKFDYAAKKYSVTVDGQALSVNGATSFDLCTASTEVTAIDFKGSGTLSSIRGDESTGYMVQDAAGNYYATIQAAVSAYNPANGPYVVLHEGTAPSGWKIVDVDGVKVLQRGGGGVMILTF